MVIFPHCKINIGLKVVRKRTDGYHDLQTIFYPLPVKDVLEIIEAPPGTETSMNVFGLPIQGQSTDNLCLKAYNLLKKDFPNLPPVTIYLYKNIPMGAGLGGGSSDGAFTLILLNEKYKLEISREKLLGYALELGSDCPFFILNQPAYAEGRGELMEPLELDLNPYSFLLVNSGIHVSTAAAFAQITPALPTDNLRTLVKSPLIDWKNRVINDFETSVFAQYPELQEIKDTLYSHGALYASMTGTGSTIYGIFEKNRLPLDLFEGKYRINRVV